MPKSEIRICQSCGTPFVIDAQDFLFYEKIGVPAPTWCPECRLKRQLLFRNEYCLYKRSCDAPGHSEKFISVYNTDIPLSVYDQKYWWSDEWNPLGYGYNYNFSEPFFEQFKNLFLQVPWPNLINTNSVNSEYCNSVLDLKNCYLIFAASLCENSCYAHNVDYAKESLDLFASAKDEFCYELIFCNECYKVFFSSFSTQCSDSFFLQDCQGCSNCFGCMGLRNKSYYIFNRPYSREKYIKEIKNSNLGSFKNFCPNQRRFEDFKLQYPHKYARITHSINTTGDNLQNAKDVSSCFYSFGKGIEDSKDVVISYSYLSQPPIRDSRSVYTIGRASHLIYDAASVLGASSVFFSKKIWDGHHIQYCYNCYGSNNLFGCVGLRNKSYCILNKQYTKEEYEKLVPKIIDQMNKMPYVDKKGRVYKYGEFFPPELSPFCYNETIAQEYFPLTKEQAIEQGYKWKDPEPRSYQITIKAKDLPDHIKDVKDDILDQIIGCEHQGKCNEQCTEAFKIIPQELQFYRRMNLPLPRLCPNCRHYQRLKQRNPLKLWPRQCQCHGAKSSNRVYTNTVKHFHGDQPCPNEFETTYSPDRKEIVYCEDCYKSEVV